VSSCAAHILRVDSAVRSTHTLSEFVIPILRWLLVVTLIITQVLLLLSCNNMKLSDVSHSSPEFNFEAYFTGHTKASGWFSDRFGNVKRHFCGDFLGQREGEQFVLREALYYSDDVEENRIWTLKFNEQGFTATSPSLVGIATARLHGNALQMKYKMKVNVTADDVWILGMDDWMFYQPDGNLHNSTIVSKWGIRIGSVSTQYAKHDGEMLCKLAG